MTSDPPASWAWIDGGPVGNVREEIKAEVEQSSQSLQQWRDSRPDGHTRAIMTFATTPDVKPDPELEQRKAEAQDRLATERFMGRVGRSLDEIVAGAFPWSKEEEEERARVEAQREAEAAVNRDVAQQRRIDRLEAQLTEERRAHRRAQQQLDVGREGWSKARRRARERESVDDYQRSYGGVYYR